MSFHDPRTRELPFNGSLTRAAAHHGERIGSSAESLLEAMRRRYYSASCKSLACLSFADRKACLDWLAGLPAPQGAPPVQSHSPSGKRRLVEAIAKPEGVLITLLVPYAEAAAYLAT